MCYKNVSINQFSVCGDVNDFEISIKSSQSLYTIICGGEFEQCSAFQMDLCCASTNHTLHEKRLSCACAHLIICNRITASKLGILVCHFGSDEAHTVATAYYSYLNFQTMDWLHLLCHLQCETLCTFAHKHNQAFYAFVSSICHILRACVCVYVHLVLYHLSLAFWILLRIIDTNSAGDRKWQTEIGLNSTK